MIQMQHKWNWTFQQPCADIAVKFRAAEVELIHSDRNDRRRFLRFRFFHDAAEIRDLRDVEGAGREVMFFRDG